MPILLRGSTCNILPIKSLANGDTLAGISYAPSELYPIIYVISFYKVM